ncbi:MAG: hypothetical protein ACOVRN_04145 [Flavobacterium sp.]
MKKVLGLLMASAFIMSCSKDDNNGPKVDMSKLSTTKWYYKTEKDGSAAEAPYVNECASNKDYTMFAANGVLTDAYYNADCVADVGTGAYIVSNNTITATMYGETTTVVVKELTSTKLVIESKYDSDNNGTDDTTYITTYSNQ